MLTATVEDAYRIFVGKVADARDLSFEEADAIARGRVWIGTDAHQRGLVDHIGGLKESVAAAAALAGLEEGAYGLRYFEPEQTLLQRLVIELAARAIRAADRLGASTLLAGFQELRGGMAGDMLTRLDQEWRLLSRFNDPRGIYFHCLCVIE